MLKLARPHCPTCGSERFFVFLYGLTTDEPQWLCSVCHLIFNDQQYRAWWTAITGEKIPATEILVSKYKGKSVTELPDYGVTRNYREFGTPEGTDPVNPS